MLIVDTVRAYLAGIIDGEGYIGIIERSRPASRRCKTPSFVVTVAVSMTDFATVDFIGQCFKGRTYKINRKDINPRKSYYKFDASCSIEVKCLLTAIRPFVITKKKQVELALAYLDMPVFRGGKGQAVPDYIVNARRAFVVEMKRLNQGGD